MKYKYKIHVIILYIEKYIIINSFVSTTSTSELFIYHALLVNKLLYYLLQIPHILFIATLILSCHGAEKDKPPVTVTRTELKVSRSLNPEDTQTLNVMTRDGSVAQLIVKRRDPKKQQLSLQNLNSDGPPDPKSYTGYSGPNTNWIPLSSLYLQPTILRLNTLAGAVRNVSEDRNTKINNNLASVIDSDR